MVTTTKGLELIYLDYAAAHPLTEAAKQALAESLHWFANPHSSHRLGREAKARLEQCRSGIRELLGAKKTYDLIFTASATEANNMAILGRKYERGDEILFSPTSHPSLLKPIEQMGVKRGIRMRPIALEEGRVTPATLTSVLSEKVKLVLLDHVNAQSGLICDIMACGKVVGEQAPQAHVHVDAAQSFTKLPLCLGSEAVDSVTLSGHKMGGPRGVAALLAKRYTVGPIIFGGGQEQGLRSGTENLSLIWAFYRCAVDEGGERDYGHLTGLKQQLLQGLAAKGAKFPFVQDYSADHICSFLYPEESSDTLIQRLNEQNIFIAQGSACSSHLIERRQVVEAFALAPGDAEHLLRVSLSFQTTANELQHFLQVL